MKGIRLPNFKIVRLIGATSADEGEPSPQGSQLESLFTLPSNQSESSYLALSQSKNFEKPPSRQSTVATPPGSYRPANRHHATQQNVQHHFRHAPHRRHVLIWD
ncbi:hypothetical protein TNCV_902061 [Trichonephila clavipes]|nr:hypothetical protein TNCV_902061 [Trichonephila clavipes]